MKTPKKQSQCQRLLAYLKRHKKGITTMEAFRELGITCVHKRIAEIDGAPEWNNKTQDVDTLSIIRTPERTATGSTVTRYKLAR